MSVTAPEAGNLVGAYRAVRLKTMELCEPLAIEDYGVQPMVDASPPKWHLAHTTWFFETFLLKEFADGYRPYHPRYEYLFNSYYEGVGPRHARADRGKLSRPTVAEVNDYRRHVDDAMTLLLMQATGEASTRTVLGLHHEQQHQELILTDLKVTLGQNPLRPAYRDDLICSNTAAPRLGYTSFPEGIVEIGVDANTVAANAGSFCFDNETPRHKVWLDAHRIGNRLITNAEYLQFIEDGGYTTPMLWLADGWATVCQREWQAPMYWMNREGTWFEYTLGGEGPLDLDAPVTHVSLYEADAFARWCGARLPSEAEWERAARIAPSSLEINTAAAGRLHPAAAAGGDGVEQLFGDCWEWTCSSYGSYPGFRALPGTLGEYNGKFMANQMVLRGGSCATPPGHVRPSYRNFFYPTDRWQFTGIRLAKDGDV